MRRRRTLRQYQTQTTHLLENLPSAVRTVKQLTNAKALTQYMGVLVAAGCSPKTITNYMTCVCTVLNRYVVETGVENPLKLVSLPKVTVKRPKAYPKADRQKLFAGMTPEEYLVFQFFLVTGCREQEVQFATWDDINWETNRFKVTGQGKSAVWEGPKSHEERETPLTSEVVRLLKEHRKHAESRWIFPTPSGKPNGHFLRQFKAIAHRLHLNCGHCHTTMMDGYGKNRRSVPVTCKDEAVCEKHYLHRLRKTAATMWLRGGIDLMQIKSLLGHKDLKTTQIYLSDEAETTDRVKFDKIYSAA
jgi:integrase/recombinase XerD